MAKYNDPNTDYDGRIIPVIKPPGISSFKVVHHIRKAVGIKKVGHAGTLDPFAEGLLIIGIGRTATRDLDKYMRQEKEYVATVKFGEITDTYDCTGKVVEQFSYVMPEHDRLLQVLSEFTGTIEQIPPLFSAIKVDGRRLYKAARKGIEVERKPRTITISEIELVRILADGITIKVTCSHGTYIRSLAYDIGRKLGIGAHLSALNRTRIGQFTSEHAITLENLLTQIHSTGTPNWTFMEETR